MHPVIARFLDISVARASLEKAAKSEPLDAQEQALADAAKALPKSKHTVVKTKSSPSPDAQQHLILLATHAATASLQNDSNWGPKIERAKNALKAEGANEESAHTLIAQAVLEEAFGYGDDAAGFDEAFFEETLTSLEHLAKVNEDVVSEWLETFAKRGTPGERPMRLKVAETLLDSAWSDGPEPVGPEHVDDALDTLAQSLASSELMKANELTGSFLGFLAEKQLIGKERLTRLQQVLQTAANGDALDEGLEEEADEDDDDADDAEEDDESGSAGPH